MSLRDFENKKGVTYLGGHPWANVNTHKRNISYRLRKTDGVYSLIVQGYVFEQEASGD